MLRIFHTADWHLGQSFHDFDRDYEHTCFFEWLLDRIADRKPDVLLVSGDVFDHINPPASAQKRYYDFLNTALASHPVLQIILTAGNHDAAARLEAPASILGGIRAHVIGTVERDAESRIQYSKFLIPLRDQSGEVRALALAVPFLRVSDVPFVSDSSEGAMAGVREFYRELTQQAIHVRDRDYPKAVLVAMGHCHMQDGAVSPESERNLVVGGLEFLRADMFAPEIAYVALGHLHKPQALDGGRIRYSGSPIPLSLSERGYRHQILELDFDGEGLQSVTALEIPRSVAMMRIPIGRVVPLPELVQMLKQADFGTGLKKEEYPFLEVRFLDDGPDPTRRHQVEMALEGKQVRLASTKFERTAEGEGDAQWIGMSGLADLSTIDPVTVLRGAFLEKHGAEPDVEVLAAFDQILAEVTP